MINKLKNLRRHAGRDMEIVTKTAVDICGGKKIRKNWNAVDDGAKQLKRK